MNTVKWFLVLSLFLLAFEAVNGNKGGSKSKKNKKTGKARNNKHSAPAAQPQNEADQEPTVREACSQTKATFPAHEGSTQETRNFSDFGTSDDTEGVSSTFLWLLVACVGFALVVNSYLAIRLYKLYDVENSIENF